MDPVATTHVLPLKPSKHLFAFTHSPALSNVLLVYPAICNLFNVSDISAS